MKVTTKDVEVVFLGSNGTDIYQMIADFTVLNFGRNTKKIIENLEAEDG